MSELSDHKSAPSQPKKDQPKNTVITVIAAILLWFLINAIITGMKYIIRNKNIQVKRNINADKIISPII